MMLVLPFLTKKRRDGPLHHSGRSESLLFGVAIGEPVKKLAGGPSSHEETQRKRFED